MFGIPGLFFCLPSWRDWDQMVYDDLFHVWQLLLTFGWVIYLQQAGDQVLKAARESVGTSVQVLYKPVLALHLLISYGQSKSLGQDLTKLMWKGTVRVMCPRRHDFWGAITAATDHAEVWPWEATPHTRTGAATEKARLQPVLERGKELPPRPRSGEAEERSNPTLKEQQLHGCRRAERSCSMFKVRRYRRPR